MVATTAAAGRSEGDGRVLVGQGASGNERLADRVENAMNESLEAAKQRGGKHPQKLLEADRGSQAGVR